MSHLTATHLPLERVFCKDLVFAILGPGPAVGCRAAVDYRRRAPSETISPRQPSLRCARGSGGERSAMRQNQQPNRLARPRNRPPERVAR
jgi:hypothetical protein